MPSEAGDLPYYVVEIDGEYRKLPRVTHILKSVIAKELTKWTYGYTRDAISGYIAQLVDQGVDPEEIIRMVVDADWLEDELKENRLRPDDYARERAVEGGDRHDFFERLGQASLVGDGSDITLATWGAHQAEPFTRGISRWWLQERPQVIAAETRLVSEEGGYAGTVDQVAYRPTFNGRVVVTDLKTRRGNRPCLVAHKTEAAARDCHEVWPYETDHIQTAPYQLMYNAQLWKDERLLMNADERNKLTALHRTVLIARADGTFVEEESTIDASIWDDIMSVWHKLGREV